MTGASLSLLARLGPRVKSLLECQSKKKKKEQQQRSKPAPNHPVLVRVWMVLNEQKFKNKCFEKDNTEQT